MVERNGERFLVSPGVREEDLQLADEYFEAKRRGHGPAQQIADFSQPLLDASRGDPEALEKAFSLGAIFWNMAVIEDEAAREEVIADLESKMTEDARRDFRSTAPMMMERHRRMFPELHKRPTAPTASPQAEEPAR